METGDAIISTGWVIIADQARVSVRDARHWMRQSLTNEGFYMCEVRRGGVPRGLAHAARLLLSDCFFFSLSLFIYLFQRSCLKDCLSCFLTWQSLAPVSTSASLFQRRFKGSEMDMLLLLLSQMTGAQVTEEASSSSSWLLIVQRKHNQNMKGD